jgi:replication factor A2
VTFVGQIRNISTQTTNITYKLDDGTGTIEVKQWIDTDAGSHAMDTSAATGHSSAPKLVENEWARVWGRLKAFNNKRHVGAHVIRPIADKMEITYHLLEATYVHLYFIRGPLESGGGKVAEQGGTGGTYNGMDGGLAAGPRNAQLASLSVEARRVYQMLKSTPQSNEGLHVQNLAVELRLSVPEVLKAGDELLRDSLIYTTIDDNTWALLEF